ncbi:hypothetical protein ACLOJK_022183 [Asimina triloba]
MMCRLRVNFAQVSVALVWRSVREEDDGLFGCRFDDQNSDLRDTRGFNLHDGRWCDLGAAMENMVSDGFVELIDRAGRAKERYLLSFVVESGYVISKGLVGCLSNAYELSSSDWTLLLVTKSPLKQVCELLEAGDRAWSKGGKLHFFLFVEGGREGSTLEALAIRAIVTSFARVAALGGIACYNCGAISGVGVAVEMIGVWSVDGKRVKVASRWVKPVQKGLRLGCRRLHGGKQAGSDINYLVLIFMEGVGRVTFMRLIVEGGKNNRDKETRVRKFGCTARIPYLNAPSSSTGAAMAANLQLLADDHLSTDQTRPMVSLAMSSEIPMRNLGQLCRICSSRPSSPTLTSRRQWKNPSPHRRATLWRKPIPITSGISSSSARNPSSVPDPVPDHAQKIPVAITTESMQTAEHEAAIVVADSQRIPATDPESQIPDQNQLGNWLDFHRTIPAAGQNLHFPAPTVPLQQPAADRHLLQCRRNLFLSSLSFYRLSPSAAPLQPCPPSLSPLQPLLLPS